MKLSSKISFLADILKVNDEYSGIRIQDPNPDPLVRGIEIMVRSTILIRHP
jgi:hypothetical protein